MHRTRLLLCLLLLALLTPAAWAMPVEEKRDVPVKSSPVPQEEEDGGSTVPS
jgi:hypothetical protein